MLNNLIQAAKMAGQKMGDVGAVTQALPTQSAGAVGSAAGRMPVAKGIDQLLAMTKAQPPRQLPPVQNPNMGRTLGTGIRPKTPVMSDALRRTMNA